MNYYKTAFLNIILLASNALLAQSPIEYPIEVFSMLNKEGHWIDTVQLSFTTKNYSGSAEWLYLNVNNLNEDSTMKYRIKPTSSASWQEWQTCQADFNQFTKEQAYGGLNGGFGTTRFATPIGGIEPDTQYDIQFKYDYISGRESSGYRIIDMALWLTNNKNETNQILNNRLDKDGQNWQGPYVNDPDRNSKAIEGGRLWRGEAGELLVNPNGVKIKATCADCHVNSGWDLKYFNFSDKSIVARSNFHGLSRVEGEKIAQYIRDLSVARSSKGRPWQPPFQPGPDADNDPYEWAAGEGLENVLETDQEMLAEIFSNSNPSEEQIRSRIDDFNGTMNLRTQRLAVQFPDWNGWLPTIHPKDILTVEEYDKINTAYLALRNALDTQGEITDLNNKSNVPDRFANNGIFEAFGNFATEVHNVIEGVEKNNPRSPVWADNNPVYEPEREMKLKSLAPWFSIKYFEVIHEFNLHEIHLNNILDKDVELFQWPTRDWVVFQNAAHIISERRNKSYFSLTDTTRNQQTRSIYLSSIWYQLQMTLTPGHRKGGVVSPNDWAYNLLHVHRIGEQSGIHEPARWLQNYIKSAEQRNNGLTPKESTSSTIKGWNMRELSPWRFYGTTNGNTATFDLLGADLRNRIQNVFLDEISDKLISFGDEWNRVSPSEKSRTDFELEFYDAQPVLGDPDCLFHHRRQGGGCSDANDAVEIDAIYTLLHLFKNNGNISSIVFNKLRSWADARWAFSDWPIYVEEPSHNWVFNGDMSDIIANADGQPINNAITSIEQKVEGEESLDLTGTGNMVALDHPEFQDPFTNYTVTAWFKALDTTDYQYIFEEGGGETGFGIRLNGSTLEAVVRKNNSDQVVSAASKVTPNRWHFVAVSYQNGQLNLYLNDAAPSAQLETGYGQIGHHTDGATIGGSNTLALGHGSGYELSGWIDDLRIYDGIALDSVQIRFIYDALEANILTYKLLVDGGSGSGYYEQGEQIIISAYDNNNGCFLRWEGHTNYVANSISPETIATMPDQEIHLTARTESCTPLYVNDSKNITVYPNPFVSTIELSGIGPKDIISVHSVLGVEIFKQVGASQIDLSDVSSGMYVLRVNNNQYQIIKN